MDILILEDDPSLRFALSQAIAEDGHTVHVAGNIAAAEDILEKAAPDILLLDLMIGNETSIQIADLAGYRAPLAEVVYLTGSNKFPNGELFEVSKNTSWVLRKPVDFSELKAMIGYMSQSTQNKTLPSMSPIACLRECV